MIRDSHRGTSFVHSGRLTWLVAITVASACAPTEVGSGEDDDPEPFDLQVDPDDGHGDGVVAVFDQNNVLTDELFTDGFAMEVSDLQEFFEHSPYNNRSFLASFEIDGVSAAQAIVDAANAESIHPLVLVARMQGETSMVSKTVAPSQRLLDRGLGCGCADNSTCTVSFKGIGNQLRCGAATLRRHFDGSVDGSGQWRMDLPRKTLDLVSITPENHATASIYSYTPWVHLGFGGSWLTWNVTRKYVRHAEKNGLLNNPSD